MGQLEYTSIHETNMMVLPGTLCYVERNGSPKQGIPLYKDCYVGIDYHHIMKKGSYFLIITSVNNTKSKSNENYLVVSSDGCIGWTMWQPKGFQIIQ